MFNPYPGYIHIIVSECFAVLPDSISIWSTTKIKFLGLELDSIAMEAQLPPDKLMFLQLLLCEWSSRQFSSLQITQELAKFLQFFSQVIPCSCSFLHHIIDFSTKFHSPFQRLHISRGVKADIHWWQTFCAPWNGVCLLTPLLPSVEVYTDASRRKGMGGVCFSKWFSAHLPCRYQDGDIQFKEVFAVLHAILCLDDTWAGHHLTFFCNN